MTMTWRLPRPPDTVSLADPAWPKPLFSAHAGKRNRGAFGALGFDEDFINDFK
ncbi:MULTISPECIES: hypothetical protein [Bradyrhizobium]|uniref:hypothetical protein n=1 Tax=Bradyrhizobium TaxID=374 RepID=UPI0004B34EEB|nr:hypothetical protein [Bradyrhizobium elkanii]WLA83409.1 hypothetical protein QNJ99_03485 [Bradyrhizobium elkanii]